MKKTTFILVSLLAIALTAGLVLTGCDNGTSSGGGGNPPRVPGEARYSGESSGTTYELTITENTARDVAQGEDTYVLVAATGGSITTSIGKVESFNEGTGTFILKPLNQSGTIEATVNETGLTGFTVTDGTPKWDDNTPISAQPSLTAKTSSVISIKWTGSYTASPATVEIKGDGTITVSGAPSGIGINNGTKGGFTIQNGGTISGGNSGTWVYLLQNGSKLGIIVHFETPVTNQGQTVSYALAVGNHGDYGVPQLVNLLKTSFNITFSPSPSGNWTTEAGLIGGK